MLDALRYDFAYAVRGLRRAPALTVAIIIAFALGIGVNAATFSVVDRVFFQAPPGVVDPALVRRVVAVTRRSSGEDRYQDFTTRTFADFQRVAAGVATIEGYDVERRQIGDALEKGNVGYATRGLMALAGIRADRGRFFADDENVFGEPRNVAVLSHDYWQRAFSGDPAVIGRTIRVDTTVFTVIGVAQPHFDGFDLDVVDLWAPLASLPATPEGPWWNGDFNIMRLLVRLAPGADERTLETRFGTTFLDEMTDRSPRRGTTGFRLAPLLEARGALGLGQQNDRALALLLPLAGVALLVLVVATSNVASLLLLRALRRRREMAVRVALGVSPSRLATQLVLESLALALVGGGAALVVALWTGGALRRMLLSDVHWTSTVIDARLVAFTMVVTICAGLAAGLAPLTIAWRRDITSLLRGGAETGRPRSALRIALLATQTALCMTMLGAAGVFLQSLRHATQLNLGFDADRIIAAYLYRVAPTTVEQTIATLRAMPGVELVARSNYDLRGGSGAPIVVAGDSVDSFAAPLSAYVDSAYARTVGLQLLSGRAIGREDVKNGPRVAVINDEMARRYWRGDTPVNKCFQIVYVSRGECVRIVGVVKTTTWRLTAEPQAFYYLPGTQSPFASWGSIVLIRTHGSASSNFASVERLVHAIPGDAENPPFTRLVSRQLEPQMRPWRIAAGLFGLFGLLALAAASAGIYGLVGYEVTQRTHEIGVRMTLGASASTILGMIVGSGIRTVAIGLVAGVACALASGRVIAALLFDTSPSDPTVLLVTCAVIAVAALAASVVPAWRATRVDPAISLRAE